MGASFLTPAWGLVALVAALPLAALLVASRRVERAQAALGLRLDRARGTVTSAVTLAAVIGLFALAAAQPVVDWTQTRYARADAQAFFVFDTSRSMLAAATPATPNRFERARAAAIRLRASLGDVPVGVASLTDRALPHLFPTPSTAAFDATVARAIGIERPPPSEGFNVRVTALGALSSVATQSFFSRRAHRRLLVVLTDGETRPFVEARFGAVFRRPPRIRTIFLRFWGAEERIWQPAGRAEPGYRPDPSSNQAIGSLARAVGGRSYDEANLSGASAAARAIVGDGPREPIGEERSKLLLAPWIALAAFLPLVLLLWRRNGPIARGWRPERG